MCFLCIESTPACKIYDVSETALFAVISTTVHIVWGLSDESRHRGIEVLGQCELA